MRQEAVIHDAYTVPPPSLASIPRVILLGVSYQHKVLDLERALTSRITPWNPI